MKPAAPKKNVRARLMYTVDGTNYVTFDKSERVWPGFMPAYVLPATAEAFDAMVEQMSRAEHTRMRKRNPNNSTWDRYPEHFKEALREEKRATLKAIGIQPESRVARSRRDA